MSGKISENTSAGDVQCCDEAVIMVTTWSIVMETTLPLLPW